MGIQVHRAFVTNKSSVQFLHHQYNITQRVTRSLETMAMVPSRWLFLFCHIFIHLVAITMAQSQLLSHFCYNNGNFTTNSPYQSNLNNLLDSFSSINDANNGFYNISYGENPDKVNSIALCRGDVKPDACHSCIQGSTHNLTQLCPNRKEAIIWYDDCMLRYANRSIFNQMEFGPYFWMYNLNNVTEPNQFNQVLGTLLGDLMNRAASGDSLRKFATGNATTPSNQTIFALAQCTPDLSERECRNCLTNATDLLPKCCSGKQGGRVAGPSCNFRYEKDIFYAADAPPSSPPVAPPPLPGSGAEVASPPPPPSANAALKKGKENSSFQIVITFSLLLAALMIDASTFH